MLIPWKPRRQRNQDDNDDLNLETINEEDTLIPEVTGDTKARTDQPDDDAIIASFNPHQEAFLERLLKKAGYAMALEQLTAMKQQQEKNQVLQMAMQTMQNKPDNGYPGTYCSVVVLQ